MNHLKALLVFAAMVPGPTCIARQYQFSQEDLYVRCWDIDETFPWIAKGKLVYYRFERVSSSPACAAYYENPALNGAISLGAAPQNVAEVVRQEIHDVTVRFLEEQFPRFFVFVTMRGEQRVVDPDLLLDIAEEKGARPMPNASGRFPRAHVEGNEWGVAFWVRSPAGEFSQIELSGFLSPFSIRRQAVTFALEQTAQPGATDNPDDAQRFREDH